MSEDQKVRTRHTPAAKRSNKGISIVFTPAVAPRPGVYRVIRRADSKTFYVGEGGDLSQRLKTLFRCYHSKNPHPCQSAFQRAYGSFPTPDQFCEIFEVHVQDTSGLKGRLEIEEELQEKHGSNNADFYREWAKESDVPQKADKPCKQNPESHLVRITGEMRRTGTWFFSQALSEQLPAKGELVRLIFPNNERVDGRIGFSKAKFLNQARSAMKEFAAKHPKAERFSVELGFEEETCTVLIRV
jgi:hypothetical protein